MKIKYILSDLDGVIRKYPQSRDQHIESKFGLTHGTIYSAAFKNPLLEEAVCGRVKDEAWRSDIKNRIALAYSEAIAHQAVQEWTDFPGLLDNEYLVHIERHFPGIPVAVLTNGTTRLMSDLSALGIQNRFFKIFNSAEIGVCKPNPEIYHHALSELKCQPSDVLFVDDSLSHVQAAHELGFHTHHYTSLEKMLEAIKVKA